MEEKPLKDALLVFTKQTFISSHFTPGARGGSFLIALMGNCSSDVNVKVAIGRCMELSHS